MMSQELQSSGAFDPSPRHPRWFPLLFITLAYPLTGYLGLLLAIPPGYATAVWPPSGIALATVLLWGRGVWPGIWLGSFILNLWVSASGPFGLNSTNVIFCAAAATGATLQALAGNWLSRDSNSRSTTPTLDTLTSVARFVVLGSLLSSLIASSNAALWLGGLGMVPAAQLFDTFWTWWIGDAIGIMIFAPLVLIVFAQPRPLWALRRLSVGLPLAVAFSTVVALFVWNSARERTRIQGEFETLSSTLDQSFRNQLFNSAESLASLRDISSVCDPLDARKFSSFAGTFLKRNPSAAALAWVERVPHAQRAAFETTIGPITEKLDYGPRVPAEVREEYFPIRYSEPSPANAAAVGFNLTAEPNRRACLLASAASGELGVSRRIQLVQDSTPQPSIQFALPVYKAGVNLASEQSRKEHLRGFVTTVLRISHFMAGVMPLDGLNVSVQLTDQTDPADPQSLFEHLSNSASAKPLFQYANAVNLGGRTWELRVQPTHDFLNSHGSSSAWGILAGGLVLVSLLGAFLLVLTGRTAKIQVLVAERTHSLEEQMEEVLRAESALKASEKRFRSYFDLGQVGMAITSPTKGWLDVNDKLCKDLGYTREELMRLTWAEMTHPEDLSKDVAQFNRVLTGEINGYDMDKRYVRKNGTILHAAMSVTCTRKEDGSIDYFIAMIQDISERQRVRDALLQAKESAEAASRAKGDFLATMSHEIRTPMNGVIGFTELLLETPLSLEQRDYIRAIKNSGHVLLSLINDILDFSKIEAGKMEMETADFDIEPVLQEVCNLLRAQSQDKGLSLAIDIDPEARKMVQADPLRTRQVLLNLLGNAIKFTKHGGVTLRVSKAMVGTGGKSVARISLQDTGIGIPCDKQALLFQKFSQADSSTTRQFGGTGLGLAICKRLVELMGGEIGLQSRPGHGSVFWFTIPLVDTPSAKRSSSSIRRPSLSIIDPAQLDGLFCSVLLAEDNAINQTLARKMLEKLGCRVELAVNGVEAYKKLCAKKYDVVFMDCHMPEMDGYTATREIRRWESEHPERLATPIVALTANAFQGDEDECRAAGMDDFLTKPVTKDAIKKVLDRWVKLIEAPGKA